MKKYNDFHIRVLNIVATFLFIFALISVNVVKVAAYTDINGYPFVMDDFKFGIYAVDSSGNMGGAEFFGQLKEQNSYFFDMDRSLDGIYSFVFGNGLGSFVLPLNIELYDYYLVGTLYFNGQNNGVESFDIYTLFYEFLDDSGNFYTKDFESFNTMEFQNMSEGYGKSFYGKIGLSDFSNLSTFRMGVNVNGSYFDDAWFSASIVPVPKSGTEADTLNSILQTLTQINQNIITGNTLQQQTIDAINANTTNNTNWFSTLFSNLSTWYTGMTDNLRNWLYMLDDRLNTGFSNLYNQMTKEQDEQLYGYQESIIPDASEEFNTGASELGAIEEELSGTSSQYVNDYTAEAFDVSLFEQLGPSLVFVVTWFTNFWSMGGAFTACLTLCFAMFIAFYVLKTRK